MKKIILIFTFLFSYLTVVANKPAINWVTDTIDYSGYRIVFNAPDYSADNSLEQCEYHGCSYFFPLRGNTYTYLLVISFLRMTQWTIASTMDFDSELWNTFGDGYEGSRCFIKDNMYSRIDRYENGMVMIYSDIPYDVAEIANKIFDSVVIRRKTESDGAIKRTRKVLKSPGYTYDGANPAWFYYHPLEIDFLAINDRLNYGNIQD